MTVSDPAGLANPRPLAGRRILVIEDEYFLADDICSSLKELGADIAGPAGEVGEAIHIVNSGQRIDAAVVDVNLKSESIFPVAEGLRTRRIPFVFTTGYDRSVIDSRFRDIELFEKPINITMIARALAELLGEGDRREVSLSVDDRPRPPSAQAAQHPQNSSTTPAWRPRPGLPIFPPD